MVAMPSDIQVFVKWKEQTIFAGEDVECTITFKNIAQTANDAPGTSPQLRHQRRASRSFNGNSNQDGYFALKSPQALLFNGSRRSIPQTPRRATFDRSHRVSASLSSPLTGSHSFPPLHTSSHLSHAPSHKHKRSVSILSIDNEGGNGNGNEKTPVPPQFGRSRPWAHGRSASLQILPKRSAGPDDILSPAGRNPAPGFPSADSGLGPLRINEEQQPPKLSRAVSGTASPLSPLDSYRNPRGRTVPLPTDFRFPMAATPSNDSTTSNPSIGNSDSGSGARPSPKPMPKEPPSLKQQAHLAPATRILSNSSVNGSTRSSGEFYGLSNNNSTETLDSEYTNYGGTRPRPSSTRHRRHYSSLEPIGKSRGALTLLMGYAQISASFTVDGSLINQATFEEVKRKGVVGGQGIGAGDRGAAEKGRRNGGLLGALGWNAIEESLSGLLSNGDLNGLRDMRGVSSSRSIPILSTPQSLLFVDLRLGPGEETSYSFSFTLPRGLPASHKGKAIKIVYNLVIGTQRPSSPKEVQQVNRINIPFRVFSGVNDLGDVLGHDLRVPYVLLRDEARVRKVSNSPRPPSKDKSISGPTWTNAPEFLSYVDEMLEQHHLRSPLPPPATPLQRVPSADRIKPSPSCKDAIDFAILRSNQNTSSNRSSNRFEIARNGRRIAVVILNRPSHRLGETIIATIDFTDAALPCFSLRATLETSEKVDASLAVRSSTSIHRATRRVHAAFFENTLFSTRVVFTPAIPLSATPTLLTSGVRLDWELRFEFVTTHSIHDDDVSMSGTRLLELIGEDDRGSVFSSVETLPCESFEIAIPLTVYGETVREPLVEENEGYSI